MADVRALEATKRVKVAVFAGGRGAASICDALARHPHIDLYVLVNAYDDGLSTGRIRDFIPGLLGPSDLRKNIARLIPESDEAGRALKKLLEYRLPLDYSEEQGRRLLQNLIESWEQIEIKDVHSFVRKISLEQFEFVKTFTKAFADYADAQSTKFDYGDCSIGNILFAGAYLSEGKSFNAAIDAFHRFCKPRARVLNVTHGENLTLTGVKADGTLLKRESEIVAQQNPSLLKEIYLIEAKAGEPRSIDDLKAREVTPELNPEVAHVLKTAEMIVYGPGTQHSSLLPSYLTLGVAEAISENKRAEKVFIANIRRDHEIQSETANSLVEKLLFCLNRKNHIFVPAKELVNRFFFQQNKEDETYLAFDKAHFGFPEETVVQVDWEAAFDGVHTGGRVVDELLSLINDRAQLMLENVAYMVSIVVPCLNERRTVEKTLHDLQLLNFQHLGLAKEIIVVDGGSTDGSWEIISNHKSVKAHKLEKAQRGEVLRHGFSKAQGNLVMTFPSDDEYRAQDLVEIAETMVDRKFKAVFGSRAITCIALHDRIKRIYQGNRFLYAVSKYGGMALSILTLFLYERFVSDPLTSIKAFDRQLLEELNLRCKSIDLETEIVAKLSRRGEFILEVPVSFQARLKSEGKKTTVTAGIKALWNLIRLKWSHLGETSLDHHSGVQRSKVYPKAS